MRTRSAPSLTYDNWWIVGLSAPLAVLNVLALTVTLRGTGASFTFALIALLLLIGEFVVFWGFTAPVNRATDNWTMLPGNLEQLRANGNIPTQRELLSMCWRWARSLCLFSTGALCPINSA